MVVIHTASFTDSRDVHSEVGVTLNTLRRLRVLSGSYVLVSTRAGLSRLARVVALDAPRGSATQSTDGARSSTGDCAVPHF